VIQESLEEGAGMAKQDMGEELKLDDEGDDLAF
jgi:hypothetical protein